MRTNKKMLFNIVLLFVLTIIVVTIFLNINVNQKYYDYIMSMRFSKISAMLIAAFCIGGSTMIFQTIIGNVMFTPCLLGMNSLYTLIHTSIVFFIGSSHFIVQNDILAFVIDLIIMCIVATFVYGYLFKKTDYNMLYILLIGTVMSSLFLSIQSTLIRTMDPNEFDALLGTLVANFNSINNNIIVFSIILIIIIIFVLSKEIALLDVISMGRNQAINLGVDYNKVIRKLLVGVILLISIATALVGPVSFLGLILANIARQMFKTYKHKYLINASILIGMLFLVVAQIIMEQLFSYTVPVSVFINIVGGIYFLYLILRKERKLA